ncbi:hypothetical protein ACFLRW_00720, partial [Acidobacteriota bacterium]
IAYITTEEGEFQINIKSHFDSDSKIKYEEIVSNLKKELPKEYTIETNIDEKNEIFTIKITGSKEDEEAESRIKDIIEVLKEQLSTIKK